MPDQRVPEEAVKAGAEWHLRMRYGGEAPYGSGFPSPHDEKIAAEIILAAYPAIEAQIRTKVLKEVREALMKDAAIEAAREVLTRSTTPALHPQRSYDITRDVVHAAILVTEHDSTLTYEEDSEPDSMQRIIDSRADQEYGDTPGAEDSYYLCFGCEQITHADKWTYLQLDEGEYRPVRDGDSDSHLKCPNCREMHGDNYVGDGLEDGTLAQCEAAKAEFLSDDQQSPQVSSGLRDGVRKRLKTISRLLYELATPLDDRSRRERDDHALFLSKLAEQVSSTDGGLGERTAAEMLTEFHERFDYEKTSDPCLRLTLHQEEHEELVEAIESGDLAAIARELADVAYVAYGSAWSLGIDLDAALREVHRANMSKLGDDGKPVYRDDGKVLKGPNFRPPDLRLALEGHPVVIDHERGGIFLATQPIPSSESSGGGE